MKMHLKAGTRKVPRKQERVACLQQVLLEDLDFVDVQEIQCELDLGTGGNLELGLPKWEK